MNVNNTGWSSHSNEKCKRFCFAHIGNEERQAYIFASRQALSVIAMAKK